MRVRPRWDDGSFGGRTGQVWSGQELAGSVRNSVSAACDCQRPELATWPGAMASSQLAIQPALKQAGRLAEWLEGLFSSSHCGPWLRRRTRQVWNNCLEGRVPRDVGDDPVA